MLQKGSFRSLRVRTNTGLHRQGQISGSSVVFVSVSFRTNLLVRFDLFANWEVVGSTAAIFL